MHQYQSRIWALLYAGIVLGYCLYYAPYGINETDGGFITGLAWQLLNGKALYLDILYVRPPMSVWFRALELQVLPDTLAILGERWIFYGKLALYSWLGAAILFQGERRWILALFGFVVSAHCYPAVAWHTVDGILFGVLAVYLWWKGSAISLFLAGISLVCALLCKQSFYPLLLGFMLVLWFDPKRKWQKAGRFFGGVFAAMVLFFSYLGASDSLSGFFQMTSGSASGGQALQHGLLDYFLITPELALPSMLLLSPVVWWFWKGRGRGLACLAWLGWLLALPLSYAAITWLRQAHTVPFAQARALFWVASGYMLYTFYTLKKQALPATAGTLIQDRRLQAAFLLMSISWCASVSWGYNLPILFATPMVWAAMEISQTLALNLPTEKYRMAYGAILLLCLLFAFRTGYEFVYRDGQRSAMQVPMGSIFPQLSGIFSDSETADLYRDLKQLSQRYGPGIKTLPAFSQASFLTQTYPPLPLDWVVNRETNSNNSLIFKCLEEKKPILLIQKAFLEKIKTDPELALTNQVLLQGELLEETPNFLVIQWKGH